MSENESKIGVQQGVLVAGIPTSTESEVRAASLEIGMVVRQANAVAEVEFVSLSKSANHRINVSPSKLTKRECAIAA